MQACHHTLKHAALEKIKVNPDTNSFSLEDKIEHLNSQLITFPVFPIPIQCDFSKVTEDVAV